MNISTEIIKEFVQDNFKVIVTILAFLVTFYVQHASNIARINKLEEHCQSLELKIADQYEKIDAIKLDKTVFEATMIQFSTIQTDIREIRADIKELLKNRK